MIVLLWIGLVAGALIVNSCRGAWVADRKRQRAIDRIESLRPVGVPERTRIDNGRRPVPHDSDGGRP